jgi:hypothetical protein
VAQPAQWRYCIAGCKVWVFYRKKWLAATVDSVGKVQDELTRATVITLEPRHILKRRVKDLWVRKSENDYPS